MVIIEESGMRFGVYSEEDVFHKFGNLANFTSSTKKRQEGSVLSFDFFFAKVKECAVHFALRAAAAFAACFLCGDVRNLERS